MGDSLYMMTTGIKGVSRMKFHRDLGIRQATAWHMGHRIRERWDDSPKKFNGPVEADEMFVGGKEMNKHASKKLNAGRGSESKTPVAGMRDRQPGLIETEVLKDSTANTMHDFISEEPRQERRSTPTPGTASKLEDYDHEAVNHSAGEYVRDEAHTNSIESFWRCLREVTRERTTK